jgi:quercetin dioxygenase-like cupin family protein
MRFIDEIACQEGTIASKVMMKSPGGNVTLFAFSTGQELSEHTAPYDALVQCLEGETRVTIAGEAHALAAGEAILMPANVPHAVEAVSDFKMLLTMLKG